MNNIGKFQTDESSYQRLKDILPVEAQEASRIKTVSIQNPEICTVAKDGFGQELILRNNLRKDLPTVPPISRKPDSSPSFRSTSGFFDASRGDSLKKLLDRKRSN
jgi:hypothetical protein